MADEILNITNETETEDAITNIQYQAYNPYTTSFNYTDVINIVIQQQDVSASKLHIH